MSAQPLADQEVVSQLSSSLQQWLTLERFHLHKVERFQRRSRDPAFETRYFPQNCPAFELPCFWVRRRYLRVYGEVLPAANAISFSAGHGLEARVLFPIHPSCLEHCSAWLSDVAAEDAARDGLRVWAVPSSSTRTLLAWPDQAPEKATFVKTSLHSPILGDRRLYAGKIGRSIGLSSLVHASHANLPATLGYLPESLGFVPLQLAGSGAIVRSIPQEIKDGRVLVAPLFSLLGGSGSHVPLLQTLLQRSSVQPLEFVEQVLCAPFAKLWLEMSMMHGLILEAHGQDLMLALSADLRPLGRFYYRDFEGLQVDWELRLRCGHPAPHGLPHDWSWRDTYAGWGYRYSELVWYKWRISLFNYLHFVLHEVELSLRDWHERGLIRSFSCATDEVTMIFSQHLFAAIDAMFGVRIKEQYNIYRSLNRFLIFLLDLRRGISR